MPVIDFIRHGAPADSGLLLGRTDVAVSKCGWDQFEAQMGRYAWSRVITSPLRRAREPAERHAAAYRLPLRVDHDWAELDFGEWDGRSIAELRADLNIAKQLERFCNDPSAQAPPGGEQWMQLCRRVQRATVALLNDGGTQLVVTHAGPMRAVLASVLDLPMPLTWSFRLDYATRLRLLIENDARLGLWGEIIELTQP